ncbi:hypothetical protein QJS66_03325 [Kocuria rhizophila]|nr:hypothetical protein QJS66_03325 [Kocuria rhizophila]
MIAAGLAFKANIDDLRESRRRLPGTVTRQPRHGAGRGTERSLPRRPRQDCPTWSSPRTRTPSIVRTWSAARGPRRVQGTAGHRTEGKALVEYQGVVAVSSDKRTRPGTPRSRRGGLADHCASRDEELCGVVIVLVITWLTGWPYLRSIVT